MKRRQSSTSSSNQLKQLQERQFSSDSLSANSFESLFILSLKRNTLDVTVDWLIELIQRDYEKDGGQLILKKIPDEYILGRNTENDDDDGSGDDILIQVGATNNRLNVAAELAELKRRIDSVPVSFRIRNVNDTDKELLSYSEQQRVLLHELEALHCDEKSVLLGYPNVKLYPGQSIVQVCHREGIIGQYFPLHNDSEIDTLKKTWCQTIGRQPIQSIKNYFGESIGFYFAFLEFYAQSLVLPSIIGLCLFLCTNSINPLFALFNAIWTTVFLKRWKRKSNELAYEWGTIGIRTYEKPRPGFRGKRMTIDPVTGLLTATYPAYKTLVKEYLISWPIIFICLFVAYKVMSIYFQLETQVVEFCKDNTNPLSNFVKHVPAIFYALAVVVMNKSYRQLAEKLNEWENHRSQNSHEGHLIVKLVAFEFANTFMSIFYVAFYLQNISMLRWQIGTMLIVYQIVDNAQEVLIPLITTYRASKEIESREKKMEMPTDAAKIIRESKMMQYEGTYFDYLELFIQFGYVFLFSSVFPLAPLLALLNNMVEIRSDGFKLCQAYQRPFQRYACGINGAWMKAFEVMGIISVMTNCALLAISSYMTKEFSEYFHLNSMQLFLFIVFAEHIVLGVMLIINYVVPDMPKHVKIALNKQQYKVRSKSFD